MEENSSILTLGHQGQETVTDLEMHRQPSQSTHQMKEEEPQFGNCGYKPHLRGTISERPGIRLGEMRGNRAGLRSHSHLGGEWG